METKYSYSYKFAEENHYLIDDIINQEKDFIQYLNKLLEIRRGNIIYQELKEALTDAIFDKIIENTSDTLKARVFFDMKEDLFLFLNMYSERCFQTAWRSNELFQEFRNSLPISINDWTKYVVEVFEDPSVLKKFVEYDQEKEIFHDININIINGELQDAVDIGDVEKFSKLLEKLRIARHGK